VPSATDDVTISIVPRYPVLSASITLNNFTINAGSVDFGSYTLTTNGVTAINAGTLSNGTLLAQGVTTSFGNNSGAPVLNVTVTVNSANISNIQNTIFNYTVSITKNGGGFDYCQGNNRFNAPTSLTMTGGQRLLMSYSAGDTFNADLTLTVNKPDNNYSISMAWSGQNYFNGDIILNLN